MLGLVITAAVVLIVAIAAVFSLVYWHTVHRILDKRSRSKQFQSVQNQYVSDQTLVELSHNFTEGEDMVYWADRQHPIRFWLPASFLVFASVMFLVLAFVAERLIGPVTVNLPANRTTEGQPVHLDFVRYAWILPLAVSWIPLVVIWSMALIWRAVIRLITNKGLSLENQPWAWAFWLWSSEKHDPQPLEHIVSVEHRSTFFGRIFHYGTVMVKTYLQENEDEEFHEIRFVRYHEEFAAVLDKLRVEAQSMAGAPSLMEGVASAVRQEIRRSRPSTAPRRYGQQRHRGR